MAEYVLNRDVGATDELGFSRFLKALFGEGVINIRTTTSWKVVQRGAGANMSVDIGAGDGFIAIGTYLHVAFSDATKNVTVASADPTNPRIDTIVAYIDRSVQSSASNNNPNALKFKAVTGTAAGSPSAPNGAAIQTSVGASNPYLVLANVAVSAAAANIVTANITDTRVTLAIGSKLYGGSSNTVGHTVPNIADDTVALLAAAQTLLNKTLTSPTITSPTITGTPTITGDSGWQAGLGAPDTVTYLGNRSYSLVYNSVDKTGLVSNGMRLRCTRTVTAPTQCTDLESGSSQYYSKTTPGGTTFTDDFAAGTWVKLESYTNTAILSRYNGTSGWIFYINSSGQVILAGYNASAANESYVKSNQSIAIGKWTHIAAQLDMSAFTATTTTSYVMIDGVDVPSVVARTGTNPTALIQAGDLNIGSFSGANFLDGKIAQTFYSSGKITQANIRTLYSQGITSTNITDFLIVSAYSFSNSINDLNTTTANNLTANGSAVATNADSPFTQDDTGTPTGTIDCALIMNKVFSTNTTLTVQVPEGCTIPTSGGVSAVSYSAQKVPYGFPAQLGRWRILTMIATDLVTGTTSNTWTSGSPDGQFVLNIPTGDWEATNEVSHYSDVGGSNNAEHWASLSTSSNSESDKSFTTYQRFGLAATNTFFSSHSTKTGFISVATPTNYYSVIKAVNATGNQRFTTGGNDPSIISAIPQHL